MTAVSTFTWLDHRDDDQQRVRDALAALDQPGIVDPLGFGVVRDAFSNMLFPGVSTVQTRARYFLLVPWVYERLRQERVSPKGASERAKALEIAIIEALLRGSDDHEGIIGRNSRQSTQQLPSFIYWAGLGRWGIRRFAGTRQEYFAAIGQHRERDREEFWPGLPEKPDELFEEASLALGPEEADFLRDRVLGHTKGTYLELLVRDGDSEQTGEAPWTHPLAAEAPVEIRDQLQHARLFAVGVWGASLLYNVELSDRLEEDGHEPLSDDFRTSLDDWLDEVGQLEPDYAAWDRGAFWDLVQRRNARALGVRGFIDWWLDFVVRGAAEEAVASPEVRRRLAKQEIRVKGARAKLANRQARERSPGAQGGGMLGFRWPQVSRIVGDIHLGLEQHA